LPLIFNLVPRSHSPLKVTNSIGSGMRFRDDLQFRLGFIINISNMEAADAVFSVSF
jgi:hypothetical protein